jgi:hypothetical protein
MDLVDGVLGDFERGAGGRDADERADRRAGVDQLRAEGAPSTIRSVSDIRIPCLGDRGRWRQVKPRAIRDTVTALLASLPAAFVFTAAGPASGHHGIGRLLWRSGPARGPVAVTGMDIAQIEDGRIRVLTVSVDAPAA